MTYVLIALIIGLTIMVVVSLVRGIVAFLQSTREDLERDPSEGPSPMQLRQSQAMFARVKYQALAVIVVAVLLALAH